MKQRLAPGPHPIPGGNIAAVEAAVYRLEMGATLIVITSEAYSRQAAKGRPRIADLAHVVLDNGGPPGDASTAFDPDDPRVGAVSTVAGAALINAAVVETVALLRARNIAPPVNVSAYMPGSAAPNAASVARYQYSNPHL